MEIEILEKKTNDLLNREEVKFKVIHKNAATPPRDSIAAKLAAILNSDRSNTILKEVRGEYGVQYSIGYADVYEDAQVINQLVPKYLRKRNGLLKEESG
ncbi:MAG: 30S ribosomal protein S24e [Candidatus Heimdallarchaeota archaeon]|nr:30S ribosomal protein S24e [Candidatus Heimdallarchaeota archaeon]